MWIARCVVPIVWQDWISQIRYLPDLNAVVITCTNGAVQVLDRDMERLINSYQEATPIYQLAWSKQSHLLAFSGASRDVTLWNPYSRRKQGSLTGHSAPVAGVEFDDVDARVITLAKDLSVRVWDLRSMRCVRGEYAMTGHGRVPRFLLVYYHPYPTCLHNSQTMADLCGSCLLTDANLP